MTPASSSCPLSSRVCAFLRSCAGYALAAGAFLGAAFLLLVALSALALFLCLLAVGEWVSRPFSRRPAPSALLKRATPKK